MSAYLSYFKLRFKVNLQWRSAAVAGICTQLFWGIVYIFLIFSSIIFNIALKHYTSTGSIKMSNRAFFIARG